MINFHEQALTRSISSILVKKSICVNRGIRILFGNGFGNVVW